MLRQQFMRTRLPRVPTELTAIEIGEANTMKTSSVSQRTVFAVTWVPVLAFGAILTVPAFVGVLGKHYGMSGAELGRLASAEWLACIIGTYLTNNKSIYQLARWVPLICVLPILANVAGVLLVSHVPLILFHPLGAFGAGVCFGYVLKVFDASRKQERNFGIFLALFNLSELGVFQLIAYLTNKYSAAALFIVYTVLAVGALIISLAVRASITDMILPQVALTEGQRQSRPSTIILISVLSMGLSYIAFGMVWPFVQLMGVARGFSVLNVANGSSAYAVTGILGSLAAATLSPPVHRAAVFSIALCALLSSLYMLYAGASYALFFIGCSIFGFYWPFYFTLHMGIIARSDHSGRGIVLCGVAPSLGAITGSFLGGMLIQGTNYLPLARTAAALCIIGLACTLATMTGMKPVKPFEPY